MRTDEFDAIVAIINPYNYHFVSLFIIFSIFDKKSAVTLISDLLMMQFQNKTWTEVYRDQFILWSANRSGVIHNLVLNAVMQFDLCWSILMLQKTASSILFTVF